MTGKPWRARAMQDRVAQAISQRHNLPEMLGRVLAARGVMLDEVQDFLAPSIRQTMPDPNSLQDMKVAAERLAGAICANEQIAVIGDYDVDGVTSSTLLLQFMTALGRTVDIYIPNRLTEGYGPSIEAIDKLKSRGAQLLITVDCGIQAYEPVEHAGRLGLDVIIVDHHQANEVLPQAVAVVNPNRLDDLSGQGHLAAVGVTFLLIAAVTRQLREDGWFKASGTEAPDLLSWLDLVALGTVCDVVPLRGVNRAYVTQGLKMMAQRRNIGIACLADTARLGRKLDVHALAFVLGPRINAAGRLGRSEVGIKLMSATERGEASEAAQILEQLNKKRQQIELQLVDDAMSQAKNSLSEKADLPILIVAGQGWHPGVLGLVSSRLKERFERPAIAIGFGSTNEGVGSGRSISGVDLGAAITGAAEAGILVKGGGHAMAAGLTMQRNKLDEFCAHMEEALRAPSKIAMAETALEVDGALSAGGATNDLIELLERAGPYGAGSPHPVFVFPAHRISYADLAGNEHVRCRLTADDGSHLQAIAFRSIGTQLGETLLSERQMPLHVAGRLVINDWGGSRNPQLLIEDLALPQDTGM